MVSSRQRYSYTKLLGAITHDCIIDELSELSTVCRSIECHRDDSPNQISPSVFLGSLVPSLTPLTPALNLFTISRKVPKASTF